MRSEPPRNNSKYAYRDSGALLWFGIVRELRVASDGVGIALGIHKITGVWDMGKNQSVE